MLEASSVKLSLSIFTNIAECLAMPAVSSRPSPGSFRQTIVGLGIVAALSEPPEPREARIAVSPRSSSIPILSTRPGRGKLPATAQDDETEDSESYTCVISRRGGGAAESKWEYFSGKLGSLPAASDQSPAGEEDFLSSCNLCRKKLHGLDIFMYRGEKAFCSAECRYQQILSDEMKENCGPEALTDPYESSSPRIFLTGVVVAA